MTQIDFHVNAPTKIAHACRLARKGYATGRRMVIYSSDAGVLSRLDRELWTFSALDFIPHCRVTDELASETPILLAGPADADGCAHHEVLVNLDREHPDFFSRFERLIEVVADDQDDLEAGRRRWKFYKDRGYALTRHDLASASTSAAP